jgi:hypothetical protein
VLPVGWVVLKADRALIERVVADSSERVYGDLQRISRRRVVDI